MLTRLEASTLQRLANGELIKQIAIDDATSHSAVDKRIKRIKRKLNAKTLCECVYKATKTGIICLLLITTSALEIEISINPDIDTDMNRRASRQMRTKRKETDLL